jgi:Rieske Fe-S protein
MASGCSGAATGPATFGDVPAGNAASLSVGDLRVIPNASACIARDSQGVYAMTLTCTHQGCDMSFDGQVLPSGIFCGCHGSKFDANGNVVRGPANAPLEHFAVSADAQGNLTVHGGTTVSPSTRLAV